MSTEPNDLPTIPLPAPVQELMERLDTLMTRGPLVKARLEAIRSMILTGYVHHDLWLGARIVMDILEDPDPEHRYDRIQEVPEACRLWVFRILPDAPLDMLPEKYHAALRNASVLLHCPIVYPP